MRDGAETREGFKTILLSLDKLFELRSKIDPATVLESIKERQRS